MVRRSLVMLAVLVAGACKDGSGPTDAPTPVITDISPDSATVGVAEVRLSVTGSGFRRASVIRWDGRALPTTFVTETQLTAAVPAADLQTGGQVTVTVQTPAPGGGISGGATFMLRNPAPAIAALSVDTGRVGYGDRQVTITGSGFVLGAAVLWNGSMRPASYVSPTQLTFTPGTADLAQAGPVELRVANPQPGGGSSNPATFTVLNRAPFAWLPSRGGHAGLGGFTLTIHGEGFVSGATVLWNGVARPATFISPARLSVAVTDADAAAPATIRLAVVNPLSAGLASNESVLTLRTVKPTSPDAYLVNYRANDIVWDSGTQNLYLTTRADDTIEPQSLLRLDPYTRFTTGTLRLENPNRLVRTDNGQYLYVGLDGAAGVRRVTIAGFAPGLQWGLGSGQTPLVAGDLEAVPGEPNSVVVSRQNTCCTPSFEGVVVYDNGVARPNAIPAGMRSGRITFAGDRTMLFGYANQQPPHQLQLMPVTPSGVIMTFSAEGLVSGTATDIEGARDRVYATDGAVVDPAQMAVVGRMGGGGMALATDDITGRVYLARPGRIDVYDMYSFRLLGFIPITDQEVRRIIRFGSDGLAYIAPTRVVLVRDPIVGI